jgi:hypothetical protein
MLIYAELLQCDTLIFLIYNSVEFKFIFLHTNRVILLLF